MPGNPCDAVLRDRVHFLAHAQQPSGPAALHAPLEQTAAGQVLARWRTVNTEAQVRRIDPFDAREAANDDSPGCYSVDGADPVALSELVSALRTTEGVLAANHPARIETPEPERRNGLARVAFSLRSLARSMIGAWTNKARRECRFDTAQFPDTPDAPPVFVFDHGEPTHRDLIGAGTGCLTYRGHSSPLQKTELHGQKVAGVLAGRAKGAMRGCCNAKVEYFNLWKDRTSNGQTESAYSSDAFVQALYAFIDSPSRVLNLSLSSMSDDAVLQALLTLAMSKGKLIVVAQPKLAASKFPSEVPDVVVVGTEREERADTQGASAWIWAHGHDVDLLGSEDGYVTDSASSFSAPAVAAAAWLVLQACPHLSASDARDLLAKTAHPPGGNRHHWFGHGMLDVKALADSVRTLRCR